MSPLFRTLLELLRLRIGPQDVPFSRELLYGSVVFFIVVSTLQAWSIDGAGSAIIQALAAAVIAAAFIIGLLQMRGFGARGAQTLTAFFATQGALAVLLLGPMRALAPGLKQIAANPDMTPPALPALPALVTIVVVIWSVAVTAHILRNALEVSFPAGVGLAILQSVLVNLFVAPLMQMTGV